jgi:glycosyltransferase involved in cell wall biosynthesis
MMKTAVIPAYNEETTLSEVLQKTGPLVDQIIVVDDGSEDRTAAIARAHGARVVCHPINRGLGAALGTGFAAALASGAEAVITLDGDGQHDPAEIPNFIQELERGADMVIGSRMLTRRGMPWHRQAAQLVGNVATFVLFGAWVTDSQSGYRAFRREALQKITVRTNRMEVSSELVAEARRHRLRLKEIPIAAIYTDYSLSKGQSFWVGIKTLLKLVLRRIT